MSDKVKKILSFVLIFGTLAIVLLVGFKGDDFGNALQTLRSMAPIWIVLCFAAYAINVLCDAGALWYFLRRQGCDIGMAYALFVSITGTYYSDITPGASGGQPMQLFYLGKEGVPLGLGTSALTVKFMCLQSMLAILSTVLWIVFRDYVAAQVGGNMWILVIGYIYNIVVVAFALLLGTSRKLVGFLLKAGLKIGTALHLIKDPEKARQSCLEMQTTYHESFSMLLRHPVDLLIQLLFCLVQLAAQMAIICFLFSAFGLTGHGPLQISTMGILQYISAAYTPLPGASGAQEGVFALYFSGIFPGSLCVAALLLWRFFTYYMWLIIGAIVSVWNGIRPFHRKKVN